MQVSEWTIISLGSLIAEAIVAYEFLIKLEERYSGYKENPACDTDFIIHEKVRFPEFRGNLKFLRFSTS